jgi:hypothetical protein
VQPAKAIILAAATEILRVVINVIVVIPRVNSHVSAAHKCHRELSRNISRT